MKGIVLAGRILGNVKEWHYCGLCRVFSENDQGLCKLIRLVNTIQQADEMRHTKEINFSGLWMLCILCRIIIVSVGKSS